MKNAILKGTILLTVTGLITRVLGFYYRICLADALGAEYLGIYQLVFPVYGICYTLYASGIQTAVSKLVAEENSRGNVSLSSCLMRRSMLLAFGIALTLSALVYLGAAPCAKYFLMEERAADSLRILSFVFPFCAVTACINGYYIGCKKTAVPAFTQLLEQVVRIGFVLYLVTLPAFEGEKNRCLAAVIGLVLGEVASNLFNCISYRLHRTKVLRHTSPCEITGIMKRLLLLSVPLSLNRLVINILHSVEAVFIPGMLRLSGLSNSEALSLYGILNGMAIPFILFPSAIPNALSVLLLPSVSENMDEKNRPRLQKCVSNAVKYSVIIGLFSTAVFFYFGRDIGTAIYHNALAGDYLRILSPLCPLLYLSTTLCSVINGLGKPHLTFFTTVSGLLIRLAILVFLVPKTGIYGVLIGLLASQLVSTLLETILVIRNCNTFPPVSQWLVIPAALAFLPAPLFLRLYRFLQTETASASTLFLLLVCGIFCSIYIALLFLGKIIRKEDWKE
ncbi:MAG: polysaccharide biosynthesis protein [Lachnospiraceae bacterium]|nr:polysaccharide biosynthesis protein [Lachnospiraceae bacterium]